MITGTLPFNVKKVSSARFEIKKLIKPKYKGLVLSLELKDIKYAPIIEKTAPSASSTIIYNLALLNYCNYNHLIKNTYKYNMYLTIISKINLKVIIARIYK